MSIPPPPDTAALQQSPPPPPDTAALQQSPPPPPDPAALQQSPPPPPDPAALQQSPPPPPIDSSPPPPPPDSSPPPPQSNNNGGGSYGVPPPPPPPPPPPTWSSHSKPLAPPPPPSDGFSSLSTTNVALVAGIAVGAALMLVVIIMLIVSCTRKKKRKQHDQMRYYRDNSTGSKFSAYYSGPQQDGQTHGNWQANVAPNKTDHIVRIPPHQGGAVMLSVPHSSILSSGEMSSDYSGNLGPLRPPPPPSFALGFTKSTFTYDELAAATGGFSNANMVGEGGYSFVYRGILPNGKKIAVKCLKSESRQGDREFQAEVEIISRVHHRHLVSLVGHCIGESQRMLVYEFLPNKTLEYHLHESGLPTMTWTTRQRIGLGAAKGLAYLHEDCHPTIIHRDIKPSNILLDFTYEAKVSDFGLAMVTMDNHTHVSTRIMGAFGYLAPEYAASGKLTEKSDVFSFGVMLLELITGKRPVYSDFDGSLVEWARPLVTKAIEQDEYEGLVDARLEGNYDLQQMSCMVACAGACIRQSAERRPKMSQIVRALEGDVSLDDLHEMVKQGNILTVDGRMGSYGEGFRGLRKQARDSQVGMSSEYGGATGEHERSHSFSSESSQESPRGGGRHK